MIDRRIGAQLYTVRDYTQNYEDFEETLRKVAEIGYQAIQLSAIGPIEPELIRKACDKYHLIPVCTHRGMDEYINHLEESIAFHQTIGCPLAGLGAYSKVFSGFTDDDIREFVRDMNHVTEEFRKNGMNFAYHNHAAEFSRMSDGKWVMDYFLENGEFDFIFDVYWSAFAGVDPARMILKLGERARVLHFKDLKFVPSESRPQVIAEVMEGNLDWDSIIAAADEAKAGWAMVEQDTCPGNPFDSLKISYQNLLTKGFH